MSKQYLYLVIFIFSLGLVLWLTTAANQLGDCYNLIARDYVQYPYEFHAKKITKERYTEIFLAFNQDVVKCQQQVSQRTWLPPMVTRGLTFFVLQGKLLPSVEELEKSLLENQ